MDRISHRRRALTGSLAALPLAAGAASPSAGGSKDGAPRVLRYAFRVAETGFDPAQVQDLYSNTVMANIFDAPLTYDFLARPARVVLNTAESMHEYSRDFTVLTLRIRPGIYFQEHTAFGGRKRELVAEDYVYSIKRFFDPRYKSPRVYLLENAEIVGMAPLRAAALKGAKFNYDVEVEGVRTLDRFTLRLQFAKPSPRFYLNLADNSFLGAVAREVVESVDEKQIMAQPIGTGPFRLVDWRRSSRTVLERNPGYREVYYDAQPPEADAGAQAIAAKLAGKRLPLIDRVEVYIVEENQPRWLAFLNGEHDLIDEIPYDFADLIIPNNRLAPNLVKRGVQFDRAPRATVDMALFNLENPVVGGYAPENVALRRAIGLAYPVEDEIRLVRKGQSIPSQSPVPPIAAGFDGGFKSEMSEYNPARARALLDAFGYVDRDGDGWREQPDGSPLVLEYATQPDQQSRQLAELWEKGMKAVGLKIVFKVAKWPENLKASRAGKLMMWGAGWSATTPDGDSFLGLAYVPNKGDANHSRFDLPAFNALYRQQQEMPDGPERQKVMQEASKLMVAYVPYKLAGHRMATDLMQPWVIGFRRNPFVREFFKFLDVDPAIRAQEAP